MGDGSSDVQMLIGSFYVDHLEESFLVRLPDSPSYLRRNQGLLLPRPHKVGEGKPPTLFCSLTLIFPSLLENNGARNVVQNFT